MRSLSQSLPAFVLRFLVGHCHRRLPVFLQKFHQLVAIVCLSSFAALAQQAPKPAAPPPIKPANPEQSTSKTEAAAPKPEAAAAAVSADAPVITIKNMCSGPTGDVGSTSTKECATTHTKAQVDH